MSAPAGPIATTPGHPAATWVVAASLVAFAVVLTLLSRSMAAGNVTQPQALLVLACAGVACGTIYVLFLLRARGRAPSVALIVLVALVARGLVCTSPPLLETDFHRYLWDGALTAHGISPYQLAPAKLDAGDLGSGSNATLESLVKDAQGVLNRINHPHLTTIYPPVAQLFFAAAHAITPFHPTGLRAIFFAADATTFGLLVLVLRSLGLPVGQIAWYAWNPILLREVYSSVHMDALLLPVIAASMLAAVRHRAGLAAVLLTLAAGIKVWPVVLVPIIIRTLLGRWRTLMATLAGCAATTAVTWAPVAQVPHNENSGFLAYGRGWQNNDGFFRAGIWITERFLLSFDADPTHSHGFMRVLAASLVGCVVIRQLVAPVRDGGDVMRRCLWIVAAVFLLSPTQFPWYWLWMLPFLTIFPYPPLLLYTALLPVYYAQDLLVYPAAHWIQHAPVWILLAWHGVQGRSVRRNARSLEPEVGRA
jgi:hypothetical protein